MALVHFVPLSANDPQPLARYPTATKLVPN
jgi:hypothetical protein